MKRYVALLRGINVGGNNKVDMSELRLSFEKMGFENVVTYINSGNVIFTSDETDVLKVQVVCMDAIKDCSGLEISVAVVEDSELSSALPHAPSWWGVGVDSKHNAIFVIQPSSVEEIVGIIGETKPEYEKIAQVGNVIFWSAPKETFSRTRLSKIVGTKAYGKITIRNDKTTKKLLELLRSCV